MLIQPNKPVIFALPHTSKEVEKAMDQFRQVIKGKKRLFIEMNDITHLRIDPFADFELLVRVAQQNGVEVIPLDKNERPKFKFTLDKKAKVVRVPDLSEEVSNPHWPNSIGYPAYRNLDLREKKWERMLVGTTSRDIIVMHTGHAEEMIKRLKLPKSNILYFAPNDKGNQELRRMFAKNERRRFEVERIARGLAKSKKRMVLKQKRIK